MLLAIIKIASVLYYDTTIYLSHYYFLKFYEYMETCFSIQSILAFFLTQLNLH